MFPRFAIFQAFLCVSTLRDLYHGKRRRIGGIRARPPGRRVNVLPLDHCDPQFNEEILKGELCQGVAVL